MHLYLVYLRGGKPLKKIPGGGECKKLDGGLWLVRTKRTRSRLYHDVKHKAEPDGLLVAPLDGDPKFKGMADGALKWVRGE